jgi:hypothetical protein
LIEGEDYFHLTHNEMALINENRRVNKSSQGVIVFTLAGYMMLAKSLTDPLAWQVQRELVNGYFKQLQTAPQWEEPMLNDLLNIGHSVEKTLIEVTHTKKGEIISVDALGQKSDPNSTKHQESTTPHKPAWILIVETLFAEIDNENIPEKMRQNILMTNEVITSLTGKREKHTCLFFRASNVMAFFHKDPRFFDLMNVSLINTAKDLLTQLDKAGVLAFGEKTREKGIPVNLNTPSDVRRVPHLVALDLVVLEQDYGVVMSSSEGIAKTLR